MLLSQLAPSWPIAVGRHLLLTATQRAVTGRATLTVNGDIVTIMVDAKGLFLNRVHPQHIHGWMGASKDATCPAPTADTDGDRLVEVGEGLPFYGPVLVPLDTDL